MDAGFIFVRTGLDEADREVPAIAESVTATDLATVLGDREGPLVSTAEHVLAALRGMGVDNAIIEVDGPEVPIMDGSAAAFVAAIDQAGIVTQSASRRFIQVLKPVQVAIGDSFGELRPHAGGFRVEVEIDFANPVIGRQNFSLDLNPESFRREISRARTFGFMNDVARLWSAGFARGASFENTVVLDDNRLLNTEGLRYCRRMRPPQGAGRGWRSDPGRFAAARRLPLGARRPQAEPRRADGPAGRSQRLAGGRGRTGTPSPRPCRGRRGHGGRLDRPGLWPGRFLTFGFEMS